MTRESLTDAYLQASAGIPARDLLGELPQSDFLNALYKGRYLSRPVFLGHEEHQRLVADLDNFRTALTSLPDRLYGGDLTAFARAVGMSELQVSAVMRSRGPAPTRVGRLDMYADTSGLRVLEVNMGGALGGLDCADMSRALLEHPVLASFAERHDLTYVDTMQELVDSVFAESGFEPGSRPVVAMTDWPATFDKLSSYMTHYCARWQELGLDAHPCHVGHLDVRDDGVWLGDRKVDIIYRMFLIEDLLESAEAPGLMNPVLDAAHRGQVKIFTPMDAEVFGSKGALAMLSDERNRGLFSPAELASLDRILPWTRMVRPGKVTLENGERVDLLDYALANQEHLALKPTQLHGGHGVVLGWLPEVTPEDWHAQLTAAVDGPYVLQRRVVPVPELFQTDADDPQPWMVSWGIFTVASGYGGGFTRATTISSGTELISLTNGAAVGTVLHATT
ncbi:hypothetical protein [Actinomadura harenae]|uniref:Glutathionylspermidine synthase pre-ATP-grasp-like domain-containing protein n=1 Tax=Actinomadura harenae TaxID=2483351 RepID=A0A3M2MD29_9ACTN|nr:hypothetical protein [Actinomadura harenae]RMI47449.1 hypothetical protein EBO15_02790 [Actinomadura harenae]